MRPGVILYGPPAAGKDTVTEALHRLDPDCVAFRRLKVSSKHDGSGRYRPVSCEQLGRLRDAGLVIYENERYGNVYVVDRPGLDAAFDLGRVPVVHLGQVAGVKALHAYPAAWLPVLLWCPREVAERRLRERGSTDVEARLTAWQETERDLAGAGDFEFALRIDTDRHGPDASARLIAAALRATAPRAGLPGAVRE
jgi:guanylate kinase